MKSVKIGSIEIPVYMIIIWTVIFIYVAYIRFSIRIIHIYGSETFAIIEKEKVEKSSGQWGFRYTFNHQGERYIGVTENTNYILGDSTRIKFIEWQPSLNATVKLLETRFE